MKGECAMRRQATKEGKVFEYPKVDIGSSQMDEAESRSEEMADYLQRYSETY